MGGRASFAVSSPGTAGRHLDSAFLTLCSSRRDWLLLLLYFIYKRNSLREHNGIRFVLYFLSLFESLKTSHMPVSVCRWSHYYGNPISTTFYHDAHAQRRTHTDAHTHELGVLYRPRGLSVFPEVDISSHDRQSENISSGNF